MQERDEAVVLSRCQNPAPLVTMAEMTPQQTTPLVTVVCLTYNHAAYIRGTIEGFLSQETSFPIHILVHDDASTDGTGEIVRSYADRHPMLITAILQQKNQHSQGVRVAARVIQKVQSPFLAYCEGDDLWTDAKKLQRQVAYLHANPDTGVVFTDAHCYYEKSGRTVQDYDATRKKRIPVGDVRRALLTDSPYKTCTALFRADLILDHESIATKLRTKMADYVWWLLIAEKAKFGYLPITTALYRIRTQSASHFTDDKSFLEYQRSAYRLSLYFNRRYGQLVEKRDLRNAYSRRLVDFRLARHEHARAWRTASSPPALLHAYVRWVLRAAFQRARGATRRSENERQAIVHEGCGSRTSP